MRKALPACSPVCDWPRQLDHYRVSTKTSAGSVALARLSRSDGDDPEARSSIQSFNAATNASGVIWISFRILRINGRLMS